MTVGGETGAVYDRGYRPYDGPRGGRRASVLALYQASVRRAIGLRRSWRQKFLPLGAAGRGQHPGRGQRGDRLRHPQHAAGGLPFFTYREYVGVSTALLLFVAVCAPDLVCPDRRQRVLPRHLRPAADRHRLRAGQAGAPSPAWCSPSRSSPRSCSSSARCWSARTVRCTTSPTTPPSCGRCRWRWRPWPSTTPRCRWRSSSLTARRMMAGASIFGLFIISSVVAAILRRRRRPLGGAGAAVQPPVPAAAGAGPRVPRPRRRRAVPLAGVAGAGAAGRLVGYVAVVALSVGVLLLALRWAER